jgi:Domain of unknown function (DUF4956)
MNLLNETLNQMGIEEIIRVSDDIINQSKGGSLEFLGSKLVDFDDVFKLLVRFGYNFIFTLILVRYIYYPLSKRKDYLFTYLLISSTIFILCFSLSNVKLELGFALGLFAVFGIIRYRTDAMPIKEMTYLLIVIGISVVNALANKKISHAELLLSNVIILMITYALEKLFLLKHESFKEIIYEKIEFIKPDKNQDLIADLQLRTGLNISRVEIGKIDFLKDTALLKIFYFEEEQNIK